MHALASEGSETDILENLTNHVHEHSLGPIGDLTSPVAYEQWLHP